MKLRKRRVHPWYPAAGGSSHWSSAAQPGAVWPPAKPLQEVLLLIRGTAESPALVQFISRTYVHTHTHTHGILKADTLFLSWQYFVLMFSFYKVSHKRCLGLFQHFILLKVNKKFKTLKLSRDGSAAENRSLFTAALCDAVCAQKVTHWIWGSIHEPRSHKYGKGKHKISDQPGRCFLQTCI